MYFRFSCLSRLSSVHFGTEMERPYVLHVAPTRNSTKVYRCLVTIGWFRRLKVVDEEKLLTDCR